MCLKHKQDYARITKAALHSFAIRPCRCLRFCFGVFFVLTWLVLSNAQAQTTNYALGTSALLVGPTAGSESVVLAVTPQAGTWTATADTNWLHLSLANQTGTGSANVIFSYDANPGAVRSGTITVAGLVLTVTQAGSTYVADGAVTAPVSTGLSYPFGVAVDGMGNVYIADTGNSAILKWTAANNSVSIVFSAGLNQPEVAVVDGAGNVYVADTANNAIKEWTAANSNVTTLVVTGLSGPIGVALDGAGNLYIADTGNNAVKKWTAANRSVTTLVSTGLDGPCGVAVDVAGNVYFADIGHNALKEWEAANSNVVTLVSSGLNQPLGVAVDGAGNVYVAGYGEDTIKKWTLASNTLTTLVSSGLNYPGGVAVDGAGNIYIADSWNGAIKELPYAFVDPTDRLESLAAGDDSLPVLLPATANLDAPFTPTSEPSWLTITGVTNGVVSFSFAATSSNRTGNITLLGQTIPITQGGSTYSLGTNALREGPGAGSDGVVLTVTPNSTTWTATANATWLHLAPANQSGTGSKNVVFSFDANFDVVRSSILTIAGLTLTVTQTGGFNVGTYALLEGPTAGSDSVVLAALPTADAWTVSANVGWLHIAAANQSGTGSTNVIFNYDANPGATRTGTLTIGGEAVTVTQAGSTYVPASALATLQSVGPGPDSVAVDGTGDLYVGNYYEESPDFPYGAISEHTVSGSTTILFSAEWYDLLGVAVDSVGNVYFSSSYFSSSAIYKWSANNGNLTTLVSSRVSSPCGVALDGAGNLYIADAGDNAIKEWLAANSNLITVVSMGLNSPEGVAVDAAGNIYIADLGDNAIKEWSRANNSLTTLVSTNLNAPEGIAVDGSGNVYIADTGNNAIEEWIAASNRVITLVVSSLDLPGGVAVDAAGNVYIADTGYTVNSDPLEDEYYSSVVKELGRVFVDPTLRLEGLTAGSDSLPPVPPVTENLLGPFAPVSHEPWLTITGVTNGVVSFAFSATTSSRTGYISVLGQTIPVAQGAESFSYSLGTTSLLEGPTGGTDSVVLGVSTYFAPWAATANASWLHLDQSGVGSTNVIFSYDANPGETRSGSLTIADQTLTVTQAGSNYVEAGAVTTLVSNGLSYPSGVAVDGAGNVYWADYGDSTIYKWSVANNIVTKLVSSGLDNPQDVAVDGEGNVYIADTGHATVKEWTVANGNVTTLVSRGLAQPKAVALDSGGDLYIADTGNSAIYGWNAANSNLTTLGIPGLSGPEGLAVDAAGNLYTADTGNLALKEWTPVNGNVATLAAALNQPVSVAVDGSGNVYVACYGGNTIQKWTAAISDVITLVSNGLSYPAGVAVDGTGNIYIGDQYDNAIKELPRAFVDPTPRLEGAEAGYDVLPVVLPATENLLGPFTPTSDVPWLTVGGITNGVVSYSFTATTSNRTAYIAVLGQSIPITQGTATFVFATNALLEGSTAGGDIVFLTVNPNTTAWTATANVPWLHVSLANQNGVGSTNLVFSFDANPGAVRSGALIVGGQLLTITQSASVVSLGVNSLLEGPSAGTDSVVLAVNPPGAEWTATANATWLHLSLANRSGTGSTNVVFSYDANPGATRTGTLSFVSQILTITQAGSPYVPAGVVTALVSSGLGAPHGVAPNSQGGVCIADTFNNSIKMWTQTSDSMTTIVAAGLNSPSGVAFDSMGNIYFSDSGNNAIKMWTVAGHYRAVRRGKVVIRWTLPGRGGNGSANLVPTVHSA